MKYEKPKMQIEEFQDVDIVTLSSEPSGEGEIIDSNYGGWG